MSSSMHTPQLRTAVRLSWRQAGLRSFSASPRRLDETTLLDQIKSDLKAAMRAKDSQTSTVLRSIMSEHQYALKQQGGSPPSLIQVLQKAVSRRRDAASQFRQANRQDLASNEETEATILEKLLPVQMSEADLTAIAKGVLENLKDVEGKKALGALIKGVNAKVDRASAPGALTTMRMRVGYICSKEEVRCCDRLPSNEGRSTLVHSLAWGLGLLEVDDEGEYEELWGSKGEEGTHRVRVYEPQRATMNQLTAYHTRAFVESLQGGDEHDSSSDGADEDHRGRSTNQFGLQDDCPRFEGLQDYVELVAGGSILAASLLASGEVDISIHWDGGRHHAKKSTASGFCYINDAVLSILTLRKPRKANRMDRILYLDLDLHWGDGVEEAFYNNKNVLTLSVHHFARGFFPCGGELGKGAENRVINLPLLPGAGASSWERVMKGYVQGVVEAFNPQAVVVQLGLDSLAGDPMAIWNLDATCILSSVTTILSWKRPTLLLGGGGYNSPNAARVWSLVTALTLSESYRVNISTPIPRDYKFWPSFQPEPILNVPSGQMADTNTSDYFNQISTTFEKHIKNLKESVGQ